MNQETFIKTLIYGDISETSLDILGDDAPKIYEYNALNIEQRIRLDAAATTKKFLQDNETHWTIITIYIIGCFSSGTLLAFMLLLALDAF